MLVPHALKPGARIGIIAPSYWMSESAIKKASLPFIKAGYELVFGFSTLQKENAYAGPAKERAKNLHEFFLDESIDAIICLRGGYGINRVLKYLDLDLIRKNPKILVGFSDITGLLITISQLTGLVTFHGPMLSTFKKDHEPYSFNALIDLLSGKIKNIPIPDEKPRILRPGKCTGNLWGGNLTLINNRLGSKDVLKPGDGILFIEDVNEYKYAFDRMLYQLRNSGTVESINGLLVGKLVGFKDERISFGRSLDEIVLDNFDDLDIPIVMDFPCGHGMYQCTLPVSARATLYAKEESISLELDDYPVI